MSNKIITPASPKVAALLSAATARHQAGDLVGAESQYRDVLRQSPNDPQALYLSGALDHQLEKLADSFDKLERSLTQRPDYLPAEEMLGAVALKIGKFDRAAQCFALVCARKPSPEAYANLGYALLHTRGYAKAAAAFREAIALKPHSPDTLHLLAAALRSDRQLLEAAAAYEKLLELVPQHPQGLDEYGAVLFDLGRASEAEAILRRAIAAAPARANPYTNLGRIFQSERVRAEEALTLHDKAIALDPAYADAHNNRGAALYSLSRFDEAMSSFRHAIALKPALAEAYNNLGNTLYRLGETAAAARAYAQAIAINPDYAEAHWNLGLAQLTQENFAQGWAEYAWRWKCKAFASPPRDFAQPIWQGEPLDGTLRVWGEQGLGDEILYGSMVSDLAARGIPVTWEADPRLAPLIARSYPDIQVLSRATPPLPATFDPKIRAQIPAASLGQILRANPDSFPKTRARFLAADPARRDVFRARLLKEGKTRLIGLSWVSKNQDFGVHKSCALAQLAPLWAAAGANTQFVDLQYGETDAERTAAGLDLTHLDDLDLFTDVDGLAALIAACDLVITVSNTTAHLAGALGVPVWIMTSTGSGKLWYWGADRRDSLWYPTATIFKQPARGDWDAAIADVVRHLAAGSQQTFMRAFAHHQAGALAKAEPLYLEILNATPAHYDALHMLGVLCLQAGRGEEALRFIDRAVSINVQDPIAFNHRGAILSLLGRHADALESFDRALALNPDYVEAFKNRGDVLQSLGQHDEALTSYDKALSRDPTHAQTLNNLGVSLHVLGREAEALARYDKALALSPTYAGAHSNRGDALRALGRNADAAASYRRAVETDPTLTDAWAKMGNALRDDSRYGEAITSYDRALTLDPDHIDVHVNRGKVLHEAGREDEALAALDRAIALKPDHPEAHFNKALVLLTQGDGAAGGREYEWRWKCKDSRLPRPFTQPRWQGEKLNGSLLVWGEQGIGDEILHAANLGPLSEAVPAVVWESDPRLVSLLARSYPRVRFAARQTPPVALTADPAITAQIPAGSLALHVAAPQRPYLKGDPVRTRELRARLLTPGKSRLIGISWISKNAAFGALKTCALADLARLWQAAGPAAQFVDLQYGDTRAERTAAGLDLAHLDDLDLTHDIDGLAALVAACDNVVTVSNTTAHLAGALGIPVKVLVSTGSGKLWYWGHGPAGSARYASAEVIRQSVANRWDDVIARAGASIAAGA